MNSSFHIKKVFWGIPKTRDPYVKNDSVVNEALMPRIWQRIFLFLQLCSNLADWSAPIGAHCLRVPDIMCAYMISVPRKLKPPRSQSKRNCACSRYSSFFCEAWKASAGLPYGKLESALQFKLSFPLITVQFQRNALMGTKNVFSSDSPFLKLTDELWGTFTACYSGCSFSSSIVVWSQIAVYLLFVPLLSKSVKRSKLLLQCFRSVCCTNLKDFFFCAFY